MSFTLSDAFKVASVVVAMFSGLWFLSGAIQTQPYQIANLEKQLSRHRAMIDKLGDEVKRLDKAVDRLGYSVYGSNGRRQTFPNRNGK